MGGKWGPYFLQEILVLFVIHFAMFRHSTAILLHVQLLQTNLLDQCLNLFSAGLMSVMW